MKLSRHFKEKGNKVCLVRREAFIRGVESVYASCLFFNKVNFNQTLDLRLVDRQTAKLLNRIDCSNVSFTRRVIHFSLNDVGNLDRVRRCYSHFGFTRADNVEFICMYGFNTTLAQDVERFRFLRSLPGAYVFVQQCDRKGIYIHSLAGTVLSWQM